MVWSVCDDQGELKPCSWVHQDPCDRLISDDDNTYVSRAEFLLLFPKLPGSVCAVSKGFGARSGRSCAGKSEDPVDSIATEFPQHGLVRLVPCLGAPGLSLSVFGVSEIKSTAPSFIRSMASGRKPHADTCVDAINRRGPRCS